MKRFEIEGIKVLVEYKPKNRNSYIAVAPDGTVRLRTPLRMAFRIKSLLRSRLEWIREKQHQVAQKRPLAHTLGETILLGGSMKEVANIDDLSTMIARLHIKDIISLQRCYDHYYLQQAKHEIPLHVSALSNVMNLRPNALRFRRMKRQWGNCNTKGVITLNTYLLQLPTELMRYVIAHELCHLEHMNHSRVFYELLHYHIPEGVELRKQLKAFSAY